MSTLGDNSDSEADRVAMDRPPSSYGSMCSEEDEGEDVPEDPPTAQLRIDRSESPETVITERSRTNQSSLYQDGPYLRRPQPSLLTEDPPAALHKREHVTPEWAELQSVTMSERVNDAELDEQSEALDMEVQEERPEEALEEDFDEIVEHYDEPTEPPPPPAEGAGLQFQHPHGSLTLSHVLKAMVKFLHRLHPAEMVYFKRSLSSHCRFREKYPLIADLSDALDVADKMIEVCGLGEALNLTVRNLQSIRQSSLAEELRKTCRRVLLQYDLKAAFTRRYYNLYEGRCRPGQQRYIADVYVEPVTAIRGSSEPINHEHEVRRTPYAIEETVIRAADIFRPLLQDPKPIRVVVMTGIPACGLTVAVNKFIIDWVEEKNNRDFQFVFPLPANELHYRTDARCSFLELLSKHFAEANDIRFIEKSDCTSLFILDALEVLKFPLDFQNNDALASVRTVAPLDALLTSLIKGTLLPNARVWITGHVSATYRIPSHLVDRFVELRGFTDDKKEEYFTKRTLDPELGLKVLNHVKRSKALQIISHLPLFTWMVAFIYERAFRDPEFGKRPPGITTFYSQYVVVQMNRSFEKYRGCNVEYQKWTDADKTFLEMMGKMAFRTLLEERDWFTVDDLSSVNLSYEDLRSRDGFTAEVRRKSEDVRTWVFKFVHATIQEYMAAMFVYVTFRKHGKNVLDSSKMAWLQSSKERSVAELYRAAIDRALASSNGHLDMFLRFLLGLVTPGTERNLHGYLLPHRHPKAKGTEDVVKLLNKKLKDSVHPDRRRNLLLCLVELEEGSEDP